MGVPADITPGIAAVAVKLVIDCRNPYGLADFLAAALRYHKQWDRSASSDPDWCAVIDPGERGPRIVFQRVDEEKIGKNRVHLDMQVGQDHAEAEVQRLVTIGATRVATSSRRGRACIGAPS